MERLQRELFEAAEKGNVSSLRQLLIEDPILLERVTPYYNSETALHVSALLGHLDFVEEIIRIKPDLTKKLNSQGSSPLHLASANGHADVVMALLFVSDHDTTCLAQDKDGLTPLHLAAVKGQVAVMELLLQAKSEAARLTLYGGETILHLCVKNWQVEALKLLVSSVSDPEFVKCKDGEGNSLLHLAVEYKQVETIKLLVNNGAADEVDLNAVNHKGLTAMDVLIRSRSDVRDSKIRESLNHGAAPKVNGGLGFREMHYFNLALIAKQFWNLLQHQESVTFRILKAKYFRRGDMMTAEIGYRPSYLWRSLLAAREIVQEGMAWRVGNGQEISIGNDRWIGVKNTREPLAMVVEGDREEKVEILINKNTGQWKEDEVYQRLDARDAREIMRMPLSSRAPKDRRIWRFTKHGFFTVKSAYHCAVNRFSVIRINHPSSSVISQGWKKIWHIKAIPRIRLFAWKACSNALPTRMNLYRRGGIEDPICRLCGEEPETVDHILLQCPRVSPVWYGCMARIQVSQISNISFKTFLWTCLANYPQEYVSLVIYLAWEIWKQRNGEIFEGKRLVFNEVIEKGQSRWSQMRALEQGVEQKRDRSVEHRWERPTQGRTKLNSDIATGNDGMIGLGFALRDHNGQIVLAGKKEIQAEGSTSILEGMAVRYALQMTNQYHMRADVLECDNKAFIEYVEGKTRPEVYCDILVGDVHALMKKVGCSESKYVPRSANKVAHEIAHGPNCISIRHTPEQIRATVERDVMER